MLIARSSWLKTFFTAVSALVFVWLLEATMLDSRYATLPLDMLEPSFDSSAPPTPGARLAFTATAYCKGLITSSGVAAQSGIAAADPSLLPIGSVVQLDFKNDKYDGMYTVLDVGPEIKGREIDIYMWSCYEALSFGRTPVRMTVLRMGWNPRATSRGFFERFLNRTPTGQEPLPSRPLPIRP